MPKLSKRIVDAEKPGTKPKFKWDSRLSGFGLLTLPTGAKSFVFQYRTTQGRTRRATIGKVGTLTVDAARKSADKMSGAVKAGKDPLEEKKQSPAEH